MFAGAAGGREKQVSLFAPTDWTNVEAMGRKPMSRNIWLAGAAIAICGANTAIAQPSAQPATIDEVVVTAQRREQSLTEVPISVQAVSAARMEQSVVTSSQDLLKLTPSVTFTAGFTSAATSVSIRGVSSYAQEGGVQPSTAVVVDGVPLSKQGEFVSDFADVERIEVLRGPQGTLFGKNATAGVIQIINKRPGDAFEAQAEAGYSTDDEFLVRGVVNVPLGEGAGARLVAFRRVRDNLFDNKATQINGNFYDGGGAERNWGVAGKLSLDLSDSVNLLISADYYKQRSNLGGSIGLVASQGADGKPDFLGALQLQMGAILTDPDHPFYNSDAPSDSRSSGKGISANLTVDLSDSLTLNSVTAWRQYDNDSTTDADFTPRGAWRNVGFVGPAFYPIAYVITPNGGIPRAPDRTRYASEELRLNYSADRLDAVGGVFVQLLDNKRLNTVPYILGFHPVANSGFLDNLTNSKLKDDVYSVFADATYKFTDTVFAFGGLRYSHERLRSDYHRDTWFGGPNDLYNPVTMLPTTPPDLVVDYDKTTKLNNLSGRIGLRFAPDAQRSYYVSYNRGYKGPAADLSRLAVAANAFLKPEKAGAFEAGAKATMADGRLIANVAVFHQTVKDVQQSAVVANSGGITQLANAGDLRSYGLELDVAARPSRELRLEGGLAYTHAEFRDFINACFPFQTAAQGCNVATQSQDLTGARPQQAPRFSGNLAATYDIALPSMPFDAFVKVAYAYQSRVQFGLTNDPLLREGGHGSLDATLGLNGRDDRWQLLIYGKNLTNDVFYAYKFSANGFLTRVSANLTRDYKRYGGVMLRAKF